MVNSFYKQEDLAGIASATAFLVSDTAAWITGDTITASGGLF
jgi:NAD(P)-dependent dehydrogenase (short-subunit alcohol dehydrogenase family)